MTEWDKMRDATRRREFASRDIMATKSCGCVYCDMGLKPIGGRHFAPGKGTVICGVVWKRIIITRRGG